jgi:hypothetical protein
MKAGCAIMDEINYITEVAGRPGLNAIIANDSKVDIVVLKISPPCKDCDKALAKEENLLGNKPLKPGDMNEINVADNKKSCEWYIYQKSKDGGYGGELVFNLCNDMFFRIK